MSVLMNLLIFDTLTNALIAIGVIGGVLLLSLIVWLLYRYVFRTLHLKKQAKDLIDRFDRSHAVLFGEDTQYIKRLENISTMNITYIDAYQEWNRRYKNIRDYSDAKALRVVNGLRDCFDERRFHKLLELLPEAKKEIENYERDVASLHSSLQEKFRLEDESRSLLIESKEKLRRIKQEYFQKQDDLLLVNETFNKAFRKLDDLISNAELQIENARYEEGKEILDHEIKPVVDQLAKVLLILPKECLETTTILPDKVANLKNHYEELQNAGYPLHHILLRSDLEKMNHDLSTFRERICNLDLHGIDASLKEMEEQIDRYFASFDKEKEARQIFELECKGVYQKESVLENDFINLCHALPRIRVVYLLDDEDQARINQIQNTINKCGATKRSLDTYVHSATKQPYSILVEKMRTLDTQAQEASGEIASFLTYLQSLKTDAEKSYGAIKDYYVRLSRAEVALRSLRLERLYQERLEIIDAIHQDIDSLSDDLKSQPIDVKKCNQDLEVLQKLADDFFKEVESLTSGAQVSEAAIVHANRYRLGNNDVDTALRQAETLFLQGRFKDAKSLAERAIETYGSEM